MTSQLFLANGLVDARVASTRDQVILRNVELARDDAARSAR